MPRAWHSWRACLLWGVATLLVSQSLSLFFPATMAAAVPGAAVDRPVLAFEFARTTAHLDFIFGHPGDPLRESRIAGMIAGNWLDYLFMIVYGSFVLAFFGASARATGKPHWWFAGWLGPLAALADAIENALLLSINADMAAPETELAFLPYPVWIKFTLLAVACGLAGLALVRQRAWLLALPCFVAPVMIVPGLLSPWTWGQAAVTAIALAWLAMLVWAAWRTWRPGNPQST
jgi:hypothetical protein